MTTAAIELALQQGRQAAELLENQTFNEVLTELRDAAITQWRNTSSGAPSLREILFFQVQALDGIEAVLKNRVQQASFEATKLERAARGAPKTASRWADDP